MSSREIPMNQRLARPRLQGSGTHREAAGGGLRERLSHENDHLVELFLYGCV